MDILELEVLPEIAAYEHETTPVLRCPICHWVWALSDGLTMRSRRGVDG